ncbi:MULTISPECIES: glycosyltransferase [Chryseobacterium]|uniref:glycosyltransferase n=1 Tax=Chryseobacterium TaxID=59732 RepID=UPI0028A039E6|nr:MULTISPECIES: glycosyltransferase [Chryseobacterium]
MKIIIDNSNLNAGGGLQVGLSFLNDLKELNSDDLYYIIQSPNISKQIEKKHFPENFIFYDIKDSDYKKILKRINITKKIEAEVEPNCIFTVFGPSYHKSNYPKIVGFALGQILYLDSPFYKKINFFLKTKILLISFIKSFFFKKNSNILIYETDDANSIYSKRNNYKIKGYTVNNTLNSIFNSPSVWKEIKVLKSSFNIIYLTANYPHKNLDIIPKVIDEILKIGKIESFKFNLSVSKDELEFDDKYDKYINYLGKIQIEQVPHLYQQMDILFMPTLLEVFSTTYLEAMASKIPIVTSDLSFARDICNDAALFCSPLDSKEYADAIVKVYTNHKLKENLIIKGAENLQRFGNSMDRTLKYLDIIKKYAT